MAMLGRSGTATGKRARAPTLCLAAAAVLVAFRFPSMLGGQPRKEDPRAFVQEVETEQAQEAAAPQRQSHLPMPHSGEELMTEPGSFVRVADPRLQPGEGVDHGWQQELWKSMTRAVTSGKEQVVMVISRQGCPWCDRLVPVLRNAIQQRAAFVESDEAREAAGLLGAPLRVFVYDAEEFGPLVEQFQIEGFPTMLFFGQRDVKAVMVPGYLDDENFGKVLSDVAQALPEGKKRRKFLGIFR